MSLVSLLGGVIFREFEASPVFGSRVVLDPISDLDDYAKSGAI